MKTKKYILFGEEWMYLKVYANVCVQDRLLIGELNKLIINLYKGKLIDRFFFVRYHDNDGSHLRLRFRLKDRNCIGALLNAFNKKIGPFITRRTVYRVIADTYVREIDRYGSRHIEDMETIFSHNSMDILRTLKKIKGVKEESNLWIESVSKIDYLLHYLDYNLIERKTIYDILFRGFSNGLDEESLKRKYRENRFLISERLRQEILTIDPNEPTATIATLFGVISKRFPKKTKDQKFIKLIQDYIHMNFNRVFNHNQNVLESVVYFMMSSYYRSLEIQESNKTRANLSNRSL